MIDYINLSGLSRFLQKIYDIFRSRPNMLTDETMPNGTASDPEDAFLFGIKPYHTYRVIISGEPTGNSPGDATGNISEPTQIITIGTGFVSGHTDSMVLHIDSNCLTYVTKIYYNEESQFENLQNRFIDRYDDILYFTLTAEVSTKYVISVEDLTTGENTLCCWYNLNDLPSDSDDWDIPDNEIRYNGTTQTLRLPYNDNE